MYPTEKPLELTVHGPSGALWQRINVEVFDGVQLNPQQNETVGEGKKIVSREFVCSKNSLSTMTKICQGH